MRSIDCILTSEIDTVSEQAIVFAYRHALKREPTHSELVSWSVALAGGIPFEHLVLEIIELARTQPRWQSLASTSSIEGAIVVHLSVCHYAACRFRAKSLNGHSISSAA